MQTVVELENFVKRAKSILSEDERAALIDFVAANPEAGVALGGGLRKVRFARQGAGKSGGYRILYIFGGVHMPIFLLTLFAKNEKDNLTKAELATAIEVSKTVIANYGAGK
jgi:hypothetical protein